MPRHAAPMERAFPSRRELRALHPQAQVETAPAVAPSSQASMQTPPAYISATLPPLDITPLSAPEQQQAVSTRPPRRSRMAAMIAICGVAALGLTMALPGVRFGESDSAAAAALQAQLLSTSGNDGTTSFDALNTVNVTAGDGAQTFVNFTDAAVQFPFADSVPLTDPFGERSWPVAGFHDAQDFAAPDGAPIQSIADGTVVEAGNTSDGCGFGLKTEHVIDGHTVTARYCHMQYESHAYAVGDVIRVGDPVGRVGNTGLSFGSHLHFALTVDGERTDPMPFLLKYNRATRSLDAVR